MKIAILNPSFLTNEHIERLKRVGEVVVFDDTKTEEAVITRLKGVEVAIADCWEAPLNAKTLSAIPDTKFISLNSTGFNQVDLKAASDNHVQIANVPGFSTESVAEHSLGLLLAVARRIPQGNKQMHDTPFQVDPANPTHQAYMGLELRGKTLGIFGTGAIGIRMAELGLGIGMKVIACSRTQKDLEGVKNVDFETLIRESDVISIHSALVDEYRNLFNREVLSKMKQGAIIINAARGEFVDELALADALRSGKISGYGCDFVSQWSKENPLLTFEQVVLTPHSAFFSDQSVRNMADIIVGNIESYSAGKPRNVVNS